MNENNVVFVAGLIPLNSAILKNSNNARYVSKAVANVKTIPPSKQQLTQKFLLVTRFLISYEIAMFLRLLY